MKQKRITSSQLFELADTISNMSSKAAASSQQNVENNLNGALANVLDAAKSAAFNEAHDAHNLAKSETPSSGSAKEGA